MQNKSEYMYITLGKYNAVIVIHCKNKIHHIKHKHIHMCTHAHKHRILYRIYRFLITVC